MSARRVAAAACAALTLTACSIGKPIPQAATYVVELPAATPTAARRPETLRMANVRVAAAFAGEALVYRMDEVRYTADPYNAFITEPARMLGNRIAEWLDRAGPFQSVAQPDSVRGALDANTAFLQKPFSQEVLASKVREVLDAARVKGGHLVEVGQISSRS